MRPVFISLVITLKVKANVTGCFTGEVYAAGKTKKLFRTNISHSVM